MSNIAAEVYLLVKYQVGFPHYGAKGIDGIEDIADLAEKAAVLALGTGYDEYIVEAIVIEDENGLLFEEGEVPF